MKLLFCPQCQDIVKMTYEWRACKCEACRGRYLADGLWAEVEGAPAMVMGISNDSLACAVMDYVDSDFTTNPRVEAFMVPLAKSSHVIYREEVS